MTWADFYLICFALGIAFSVLSFFLGGHHWHLPFHIHLDGGVEHGAAHGAETSHANHPTMFINPLTLAAFLAWFGGAGFLLTRFSAVWVVTGFGLAAFAGIVGASIIFWFMNKVLNHPDQFLDPADFEMTGVLGRISVPVRASGTGELIYSQAGTRRSCGARAEDGSAIAKGTEVVVTRYEKGIAYVRLWSEMAGEENEPQEKRGGQ
jgi:membrane protein implicated in regulation of membrane protease activity